jgi:hypothetical protein
MRRSELALAILIGTMLLWVLITWPGNADLGAWCEVIYRCRTPMIPSAPVP